MGPFDWKHRPPPPPPPHTHTHTHTLTPNGAASSYLLNCVVPTVLRFQKAHLVLDCNSGFFNYVLHFTCLCSSTPQDQGPAGGRVWGGGIGLTRTREALRRTSQISKHCAFLSASGRGLKPEPISPTPDSQNKTSSRAVGAARSAGDRVTRVNWEICPGIRRVNKTAESGICRILRLLGLHMENISSRFD